MSRFTMTIITALLILVRFILLPTPVARAQGDPTICYWQSTTGQTIDLSKLCGPGTGPIGASTSLQSLLAAYPQTIQQEVTQYVEQNRPSFTAQVATTCRIRRYGGAAAETTRRQALIDYQGGGAAIQARQEVIDAYAIANYCPEPAK
jgi:hypothetical protein